MSLMLKRAGPGIANHRGAQLDNRATRQAGEEVGILDEAEHQ